MSVTRSHRSTRLSVEEGFTLVEVIATFVVLAIVTLALTQVLGSSNNAISSAKVSSHEAAIAESVMEKLLVDQSWTRRADCVNTWMTPGTTCDLLSLFMSPTNTPDVDLYDDISQIRYELTVTAHGIDSAADLLGTLDKDQVIPDMFRISVTVHQNRISSLQPYTAVKDINPSSKLSVGALRLQVCGVTRQIDERMPIAECPDRSSPFAPPARWTPTVSGCTSSECQTYACAHPSYRAALCRTATAPYTDESIAQEEFISISAFPVSTNYVLRGSDGNTNGVVRGGRTDANGLDYARGLVPGRYDVAITPPSGYDLWASHSLPGGGVAIVEAGLESRSVQLLSPAATVSFGITVEEIDVSYPWEPITYPARRSGSPCVSLVATPIGRAENLSNQRGCTIRGRASIVLQRQRPGLYATRLSRSSGGWKLTRTPGFVWIDPAGWTLPETGDPTRQALLSRTFCVFERRELARLIDPTLPRCNVPPPPPVPDPNPPPPEPEPDPTPIPPPPPPPPPGGGA